MAPSSDLFSRQSSDDYDNYGWWGYSETAYIVKWAVTAVFILVIVLFLVGGYMHAQRRLKKGLPPLAYHRWLVSRRQRAQFGPQRGQQTYYHQAPYGHGPAVPMQNYGPPPPAYGEHEYVPPYAPPEGGSKVNPDQSYAHNQNQGQHSGPSQPAPAAGVYR